MVVSDDDDDNNNKSNFYWTLSERALLIAGEQKLRDVP